MFGLIIMAAIMAPNILFAIKSKNDAGDLWHCRVVEILEQIGRFGCLAFMIFNIPHTWSGFWFDGAPAVYIAADLVLTAAYCAVWAVCFRKNSMFRALALSILPCAVFLFSGIMILSVPLLAASLIFAPCHILISCKNAALAKGQ